MPSPFGIGDLGFQAYRFIDFLSHSKQTLWQILPLGPTGYGNSPYMVYSAMAVNPLLISLEKLQEEGLLKEEDLAKLPKFSIHKVNYEQVIKNKFPLLRQAWKNFQLNKSRQHALVEFAKNRKVGWKIMPYLWLLKRLTITYLGIAGKQILLGDNLKL
ncbi:4-alpha-glucanotransferase [Nostoc punctiforme]|uniref:4-alpha-glucanotransferase n=1 Tax=Nostoc punctiforme TaxID=272131 RepID=UPI00301B5221